MKYFLGIFLIILSGCVTINQASMCSSADNMQDGAICSRLVSADTNTLTFDEFIDMINAQAARNCAPVPGFNICADNQTGTAASLPARGAAIVISSDDFGNILTELETMCRMLGAQCSYQTQIKTLIQAQKSRTIK